MPQNIRAKGSVQSRMRVMESKSRNKVAAIRIYVEQELTTTIRQMLIEGGTVDDVEAELHILADYVRGQADTLRARWPDLMKGTVWEEHQLGTDLGQMDG
jgi:hypothetical protein